MRGEGPGRALGEAQGPAVADPAELAEVYRSAFGSPPYNESDDDVRRFVEHTYPRHAERDGFALATATEGDRLVGFGYGYTSAPGQWWHERVVEALGDEVRPVLAGAFELVTLAVHAEHQGRGHGAKLHDELLAGRGPAVLSTWDEPTVARSFYLRRGWETLGRMRFTPDGPEVLILRW